MLVFDESDAGSSIRIILNTLNSACDITKSTLKVNRAIESFVPAAIVSDSYLARVVSASRFLQAFC